VDEIDKIEVGQIRGDYEITFRVISGPFVSLASVGIWEVEFLKSSLDHCSPGTTAFGSIENYSLINYWYTPLARLLRKI
jgi:hypothetical protein